jgi:hypothetical protein
MKGHLTAIERMRLAAQTTPAASAVLDLKNVVLVGASFVAPVAALWAISAAVH